jgi:acyl-CoA thioesterase FadM
MTMKNVFIFPVQVRFRDIRRQGPCKQYLVFHVFYGCPVGIFPKNSQLHGFFQFSLYFIMAHIRCDYLRPVTLNTRLFLQIWVKEIGGKSFRLSYQLVDASDGSTVYAEGESVQICFDYAENRSIAVPDELKQQLQTYRS